MTDSAHLTIETLTARYDLDEPATAGSVAAGAAARRIAGILDSLGWQSASDAPAAAVAPEVAMMVRACVRGHRQLDTVRRNVAELLRRHSHPLDGSGTSVAGWTPFAAQLLDRYAGVPRSAAGIPA
ncbi:MAG: hypothetical protein H0X64_00655 [Gemmatimonadaceae bacterium]|nr:hypothetical protein [Gemmatimonadaceae bacterium]